MVLNMERDGGWEGVGEEEGGGDKGSEGEGGKWGKVLKLVK